MTIFLICLAIYILGIPVMAYVASRYGKDDGTCLAAGGVWPLCVVLWFLYYVIEIGRRHCERKKKGRGDGR